MSLIYSPDAPAPGECTPEIDPPADTVFPPDKRLAEETLPNTEQKGELKKLISDLLNPEVLKDAYPMDNLPGLIAWQLRFVEEKGGTRPEGKEFIARVKSLLRGHVAERCSLFLNLSQAETVYCNVDLAVLNEAPMVAPQQLLHRKSKAEMIAALTHSRPPQDVLNRYAVPDAFIIPTPTKEIPVALIEVKAYTHPEFEVFIDAAEKAHATQADIILNGGTQKLGVNLDQEIALFDLIRADKIRNYVKLGTTSPVVLRFCNDIPNELLVRYGKLLQSLGYTRVVIQKLPFDADELDRIALYSLATQLDNIMDNKPNQNGKKAFSDEEKTRMLDFIFEDSYIQEHGREIINSYVTLLNKSRPEKRK